MEEGRAGFPSMGRGGGQCGAGQGSLMYLAGWLCNMETLFFTNTFREIIAITGQSQWIRLVVKLLF